MLLEKWHEFIERVRSFYRGRGYLEVSTPILQRFPNLDTNVEPIPVRVKIRSNDELLWLQTSPEYSMKKLLAKYRRDIFQIAKVFRNNEIGRLHRIEFHMLEWYRIGEDYRYLISEIKDLLWELLGIDKFEEISVEEAFRSYLGIDLSKGNLKKELKKAGIYYEENEDWETLFYRAFLELERRMDTEKAVFLKDFPEELCALAKVRNGVAERFELFLNGVELANGWTEETDPEEVRRRLEKEAKSRKLPVDEEFIRAHRNMPPCAGCSIGLDRLFMIYLGKGSLEEVEL